MTDAEGESVVARWTGRTALYSFTGFLVCMGMGAVTSTLWLWWPGGESQRLLDLHKLVIGGALTCGWIAFVDLMLVHRFFVVKRWVSSRSLAGARVHVGLTAFNDQECIADAVRDFKACSDVHRVVAVDNNSVDATSHVATAAGADLVVVEERPGYGACCIRALDEAAVGADVVVLCEGDMTFSADDVKKLLAYLENCDLVLGTRATQELRQEGSQMDWALNPGNQVLAKLIQVRFWGTRLSDVGCTYRAMRVEAYRRLKPHLRVTGNHFSPHMFIEALKLQMRVLEIPVTLHKRAGVSKGVGSNKLRAARVALSMLGVLYRA